MPVVPASPNLDQLTALDHARGGPNALERLTALVAAGDAIDADAIRAVAADSGLPEAFVHGISTFYDDLLIPRAERTIRVCSGTACFAQSGGTHGAELARMLDGEEGVALSETVCLGMCHSGPAIRTGDAVDAGPGVLERVAAGVVRDAPEPHPRSILGGGGLLAHEPWTGLARAREMTPDAVIEELSASGLTGRGGAAFPAGRKWRFVRDAGGEEKVVVVNGDEGDPGSYIDKMLMEQRPELLLEGVAIAAHAIGARRAYVLVRSEYPHARPALEAAVAAADLDGVQVQVIEGAGSYVVGEETALLSCAEGLRGTVSARPPFPAQRGLYGLPTLVHNVESLCATAAIIGGDRGAARTKLVCCDAGFNDPGVVEVPFGIGVDELCHEVFGGLTAGREIKAVQIGGPLGGILPRSLLDTPFDLAPLAQVGCMVGHGSLVAFDDAFDMRALCEHLLKFGADESCGKCFPCRIGLHRAHEMVAAGGPVERGLIEPLLEALELSSLCAHGSGMPAPIRSLISHFPQELGLR